jgi:imidazolonepropionase-like amidohydrolase
VNSIAFVRGTIYADPWSEPIVDGALVVEGDRIVAVGPRQNAKLPEAAQIVDCGGAVVTAGFWNSHVHFMERKWTGADAKPADELQHLLFQEFGRYGFTSVFDLSSDLENTHAIRRRIESGEVDGPRIRSTGEGIIAAGTAPPDSVFEAMGWMKATLREVDGPDTAASAARDLLKAGADAIKVFVSSPSTPDVAVSLESMRAIVDVAHAAKAPVFVHPNGGDDVMRAVRAGADVIAHTFPRSQSWEDELTAVGAAEVALIPTLALWRDDARRIAVEQLASLRARGEAILFGTDYGAVGADPTQEYALMAQAGMSFREILASLTTTPARRFGDSQSEGTLAPGAPADIVVLDRDPTRDVTAYADVRFALRAGRKLAGGSAI